MLHEVRPSSNSPLVNGNGRHAHDTIRRNFIALPSSLSITNAPSLMTFYQYWPEQLF